MGRKHKHEEHINLERWLVSYADFVTLLFATFTALYAVSQVDKSKALAFEESIKQSMGASSYDPLRPAGGHFRGFHDYVENSSSSGVGQPAANTFPQSSVLSNAPEYIGKKSQSASMGVMSGHLLKLEENPDLANRIEVSANGDEVIIRLSEAGFFDSANGAFLGGRQYQFRAKGLENCLTLLAHVGRHHKNSGVALHSSDHCKTDSGVAGCRLDKRVTRF